MWFINPALLIHLKSICLQSTSTRILKLTLLQIKMKAVTHQAVNLPSKNYQRYITATEIRSTTSHGQIETSHCRFRRRTSKETHLRYRLHGWAEKVPPQRWKQENHTHSHGFNGADFVPCSGLYSLHDLYAQVLLTHVTQRTHVIWICLAELSRRFIISLMIPTCHHKTVGVVTSLGIYTPSRTFQIRVGLLGFACDS